MRGLTAADFAKAADAKITFGWMPGKYLEAANYVVNFAVPNFHFHLAHVYAICVTTVSSSASRTT